MAAKERRESFLQPFAPAPRRLALQALKRRPHLPHTPPPWIPLDQVPEREPVPMFPVFRLAQQALDHVHRLGRRQVEDRPRHRGHRNPVLHRHLIGGKLFVVAPDPVPGAALVRSGDVDDRPRVGADHPERGRRPVAQYRCRPRGKHRRHPTPLARNHPVAQRIDAAMQPMKASGTNPPLDLFLTPSLLQQLPPPHNPVLPPSDHRQRPVVSARPQKPLFCPGFCGLGGHPRSVSSYGARVVRALGRLARESVAER